jgi:hypothetical protein
MRRKKDMLSPLDESVLCAMPKVALPAEAPRVFYNTYKNAVGGNGMHRWVMLPWEDLPQTSRDAWGRVAKMAEELMKGETK